MATVYRPTPADIHNRIDTLIPNKDDANIIKMLASLESTTGTHKNTYITNSKGAIGVFQNTPINAKQWGINDPSNIDQAILGTGREVQYYRGRGLDNTQIGVAHFAPKDVLDSVQQSKATGTNWMATLEPKANEYAKRVTGYLGVTYAEPTPQQVVHNATSIGQIPPSTIPPAETGTAMPKGQAPDITPPKELSTPTKWKMAGNAVQAIGAASNNYAESINLKAAGNNAFSNSRAKAAEINRQGNSTQKTAYATTAHNGVDVGSVTSVDAQRLQGIYTGQAVASAKTEGDQQKIAADNNAHMAKLNGIMSLVGGFLEHKTLQANDKPTIIDQPKDSPLTQAAFGSLGANSGTNPVRNTKIGYGK